MDTQDPTLQAFLPAFHDVWGRNFDSLRGRLSHIEEVDRLFIDLIPFLNSVKPATAAVLVLNAHASFRAAITLAVSGQLMPVFMSLRGSLESVLYANAMVVNPLAEKVWLSRDKDAESKDQCRRLFTSQEAFRRLTDAHEKIFTDAVREQYAALIDFGAHPNCGPILQSTHVNKLTDGRHALTFAYIHGAASFELRQALVACAEMGVTIFLIALICTPTAPNLTTLNDQALRLQEAVPTFIRTLDLHS